MQFPSAFASLVLFFILSLYCVVAAGCRGEQKPAVQPPAVAKNETRNEPAEPEPVEDPLTSGRDFSSLRGTSPVVDRALDLKAKVDTANAEDLHRLLAHVQDRLRPLSPDARRQLADQVAAKIDADATQMQELQQYFREGPGRERFWEALELRKAVDQFLGEPDQVIGIFDDARTLLARPEDTNPLNPDLPDLLIEPQLSAGLKVLLIYAAVTAENLPNVGELELTDQLQLLYPAVVPETIPKQLVESLTLVDLSAGRPKFLIPNAGFVMGGTFQNGENHGIDCSQFVSHCTQSSNRLTTVILEYCWRELARGLDDFSEKELALREEFIRDWGLDEVLANFEVVEFNSPDDLEPGDVLIRRWTDSNTKARDGNSTIFLAPIDDVAVWGVECNRLSYPSERIDGVSYRMYNLFLPQVDVYVLRHVDRPASDSTP